MQKENPSKRLDYLIGALEYQKSQELIALKSQFHLTYDSFKPINILKNSLAEIKNTPDIKKNITSTVLGISGGFIMNKLVAVTSSSPVMKVVGTVLQFVVGNYISKYAQKKEALLVRNNLNSNQV